MLMKISIYLNNIEIRNFKMPSGNFCEDSHGGFLEKVWLKKNHNRGRSSVMKFPLPLGPMLRGKKKNN